MKVVVLPCVTVCVAGAMLPFALALVETVKVVGTAADARPERLTLLGPPAALLVIVTAPVRVPTALGVKVTLMVQFAPTAKVPQVEVCA